MALADDEKHIENILRKIIARCEELKLVAEEASGEVSEKISLLADSIINLAVLADEIDVNDEKITESS